SRGTKGPRKISILRMLQPCWKAWPKPSDASSLLTKRLRPHSAASIDETSLHLACDARPCRHCRLFSCEKSDRCAERSCGNPPSLQNLLLFPEVGRPQTVEAVRKLVTRKYRYLFYSTVDRSGEEIVILSIQHPAREREHEEV